MSIKLKAQGIAERNINKSKADPNLRHKFVPDIVFHVGKEEIDNLSLPPEDQVYVMCDYLTAEEAATYYSMTGLESSPKIFAKKVREIHNLDHPTEDREIQPLELLDASCSPDAFSIISKVALHLLSMTSLSDAERKN
jgi:hypothetical protein